MKATSVSLAALLFLSAAGAVHADPSVSNTVYGQLGHAGSRSKTDTYTLGVTAPINWQRNVWGAQASAYWDLYATHLVSNGFDNGGDNHTWLLGLTPTLRLRFDEGRSPWFADAGVGISYTDVLYRFNHKAFSTRFNFGSHVAVGYTFGNQREHELSLRLQHFSNAGIKDPNPGDTFVQLRYAHAF